MGAIKKEKQYQLLCKLEDNDEKIKLKESFNSSYIFMKYISDIPENEEFYSDDIRVYIGDIEGLEDIDDADDDRYWGLSYSLSNKRRNRIKDFFKNKLVILTPWSEERDEGTTYKGQDIKVIDLKRDQDLNDNFVEIPIFSPKNTNNANNFDEFYKLLGNSSILGRIKNLWGDGVIPEAIIWKDDVGTYVFTEIENCANNTAGISFFMTSLNTMNMGNNWLDKYYLSDDVAFIPKKEIIDISIKISSVNGNDDSSNLKENSDINNIEDLAPVNGHEDVIFNGFRNKLINDYRLTYNIKDLINFHNSIKTNIFTVLAGISGTGKSKIVTAYADSLGVKDSSHFNMISVRPFWQDDSDLLGFVDSLTNTYHPGDSMIVDTLIEASKNIDDLYIVVLDEMNLARVEHYFSQFLSVLEKDAKDRKLTLYNKELENKLYNSHLYPSEILITENVRFVGTMNIDETTYQVSDKVLDRANVITLKKVKFSERSSIRPLKDSNIHSTRTSYVDFSKNIYNDEFKLTDEELQFFDDLNECINMHLPTVGIGWRTLNSIERFVSNINHFHYNDFNDRDAFDYQVAQRILPKIRGTRMMLEGILDYDSDKSLFALLDSYKELSDFEFTRSLLNKKVKEIEVNGFAN